MSEREMVSQIGQNPFLPGGDYLNGVMAHEQYLKPLSTSVEKEKEKDPEGQKHQPQIQQQPLPQQSQQQQQPRIPEQQPQAQQQPPVPSQQQPQPKQQQQQQPQPQQPQQQRQEASKPKTGEMKLTCYRQLFKSTKVNNRKSTLKLEINLETLFSENKIFSFTASAFSSVQETRYYFKPS